jgi:hypothetical protein
MMQIIEQTYEEKVKMYMKLSKKELTQMLIHCNDIIDAIPMKIEILGKMKGSDITIAARRYQDEDKT